MGDSGLAGGTVMSPSVGVGIDGMIDILFSLGIAEVGVVATMDILLGSSPIATPVAMVVVVDMTDIR